MQSASAAPPESAQPSSDPPANVPDNSKRCVMNPQWLEFLCNVLMMPDVMRQCGLGLNKTQSGRAPNGISIDRKGLASFLNKKDHPLMAGTSIWHKGISNWILQIRSDVSSDAQWLKGPAARGKGNGPTPSSHHTGAFDLFKVIYKFRPPSEHDQYTQKPDNAPADAEQIKCCDRKMMMMNSLASVRRLLRVQALRASFRAHASSHSRTACCSHSRAARKLVRAESGAIKALVFFFPHARKEHLFSS